MKRFDSILRLVMTRSACGSITPIPLPISNSDKLIEILTRDMPVIATAVDFLPQSKLLKNSTLAPNTGCNSTQYTANQMIGNRYDDENIRVGLVTAAM